MEQYKKWLKENNVSKSYETYIKFIKDLGEELGIEKIWEVSEKDFQGALSSYDNFFEGSDVSYLKKYLIFRNFSSIYIHIYSIIKNFSNLKSRQITETKSMIIVEKELKNLGYTNIENVSNVKIGRQRKGWDLEAVKEKEQFYIEVKGIHDKNCKEVFLTKNEYDKAKHYKEKFLIAIVTNVKSKNKKDCRIFSYVGEIYKCENETLECEPFYYKLKIR